MAALVTVRNLPVGPLTGDSVVIYRSGLRWLVSDRHACRAGEPIAFCNIGLRSSDGKIRSTDPFPREQTDLQLTLVAPVAGILHQRPDASRGGWLDQLDRYQHWSAGFIPASLETTAGADIQAQWQLIFAAGERMSELAEDRSGRLTGWRRMRRAWHGEHVNHGTLVSLGTCEQNGIFLGERHDFSELLAASPGSLHVIHVGDETLVPAAAVLADRIRRDAATNAQLATDMSQGILGGPVTPGPADWHFAGSTLGALTRCPLSERYDLLTREGLASQVAVDAVVLSVSAEPKIILRHRRLGYRAYWHRFRVDTTGQAIRNWLNVSFEPLSRTIDDVQTDLKDLCKLLAERGVNHVLIMNALSSSGSESIFTYAAFSQALGDQLPSVRAKELNLMLHDLADDTDIAIVDVDSIAAGLGAAAHLPDGVHQSGPMQDEVREEILHILEQRRFFATRAQTIS
ncbi:MAG TPA: hypothetical protein VGL28_12700 [Steroidobacteraceae bacterium]|jgi:hypothetical protein